MSFSNLLAALLLLAGVSGCATPRYQTTFRLIPPPDAAGRACVERCDATQAACQTTCKTRYEACAKAVAPQVEARYGEALEQYALELKRYASALRRYEIRLHFDWMHSYPYRHYPPYWWDPWPGPYFPPPFAEPVMPTRESVRAELEKKQCEDDCGCLPAYDSCFLGCGGQRVSETVCVENCPSAK
ncbi:hypothetical protein Tbd_0681 [Thiobacillus denitrificans ATCC 25259]|uniref:Lipoprotein n=1 Tax=Thiobacillus denitrificans (strain ATCC 25259 / T1) TaxID=292415 RepID=Q3SKY7_THIDA|nr:hypothetical protein Tbd_0681 [Thiobacillus denitrificans ATCC 25259]